MIQNSARQMVRAPPITGWNLPGTAPARSRRRWRRAPTRPPPGRKLLGSVALFRESAELGYQITPTISVSALLGGLCVVAASIGSMTASVPRAISS